MNRFKLVPQIYIMLLMSILFSTHAVAAQSKIVTLDIPTMTCKFCPITIRKALQKVQGVLEAKAEYETKTATVTFDPDKTTVKALMAATKNAGYPSTVKKNN